MSRHRPSARRAAPGSSTPAAAATSSRSILRGGVGVYALRSTLTLQESHLAGSSGFNGGAGGPINYAYPGLVALDSTVFASRSQFIGGNGINGISRFSCDYQPGPGASAVVVAPGGLGLFTGACIFTGGRAGNAPIFCRPSTNGLAIEVRGTPARVTDDATLDGGTQSVVLIPPLTSIASPGIATRGTPVIFTFAGPAGTGVLTLVDAIHGHQPLPGIDGPYLLSVTAVPLQFLTIGAGGTAPWTVPVPMDPALAERFAFVQGVAFAPGVPLPSLTNAGDVRIR